MEGPRRPAALPRRVRGTPRGLRGRALGRRAQLAAPLRRRGPRAVRETSRLALAPFRVLPGLLRASGARGTLSDRICSGVAKLRLSREQILQFQ